MSQEFKVRLSGGAGRKSFTWNGQRVTQRQLTDALAQVPQVEVARNCRGSCDYIVYADDADGPSNSAVKAAGEDAEKIKLRDFVDQLSGEQRQQLEQELGGPNEMPEPAESPAPPKGRRGSSGVKKSSGRPAKSNGRPAGSRKNRTASAENIEVPTEQAELKSAPAKRSPAKSGGAKRSSTASKKNSTAAGNSSKRALSKSGSKRPRKTQEQGATATTMNAQDMASLQRQIAQRLAKTEDPQLLNQIAQLLGVDTRTITGGLGDEDNDVDNQSPDQPEFSEDFDDSEYARIRSEEEWKRKHQYDKNRGKSGNRPNVWSKKAKANNNNNNGY